MVIHAETLLSKVDEDISTAISNPALAIIQLCELLSARAI